MPAGGAWSGRSMYYGDTAIDVALAVILMTQWYLATGRALARPGGDQPSRDRDARWPWGRRSLRPNTSAPAHQCPA